MVQLHMLSQAERAAEQRCLLGSAGRCRKLTMGSRHADRAVPTFVRLSSDSDAGPIRDVIRLSTPAFCHHGLPAMHPSLSSC